MTQPTRPLQNVRACVFDAYGTLFDFASAAARCPDVPEEKRAALTALWRDKQIQYAWLRTLENRYADFWQVTGDALDFTLESLGLEAPALRERLMDLYLGLEPFAEVPAVLARPARGRVPNRHPLQRLAQNARSAGQALRARSDVRRRSVGRRGRGVQDPSGRLPIRASTRSTSRRARSRSSPPTPGTRMGPRTSACASSGATATASAASGFQAAPTSRSGRWPNCRRCSLPAPPDRRAGRRRDYNRRASSAQTKPRNQNKSKEIQVNKLGFAWFYSSESGTFQWVKSEKIKKIQPLLQVVRKPSRTAFPLALLAGRALLSAAQDETRDRIPTNRIYVAMDF